MSTPERWQRARDLFHAALELAPKDRTAFLQEACRDHPDSLQEVLSLVENHREDGFIESPAIEAVARQLASDELSSPPSAPSPAGHGCRLVDGKYALERVLGEGGMGVVHLARHRLLGDRQVAVKLIHHAARHEPSFLQRLKMEATTLGQLDPHPGIVSVTDSGLDQSGEEPLPYLVMEYLKGKTLAQELRDAGPLPLARALPVLRDVAAALNFAHQHGVLHRDLKPANVFLASDGTKILDFGLARLLDRTPGSDGEASGAGRGENAGPASPEMMDPAKGPGTRFTAEGLIAGTPAYMAPELFAGKRATLASDIYAFGVLAYEVLTGAPPFEGASGDAITPPSKRASALPPEIDSAVLALLDKDPDRRPTTAVAAVNSIQGAQAAAERRQILRREIPRRLGLAAVLTAAGAVCASLAGRLPVVDHVERRLLDVRQGLRPLRSPDPRLLVLSVDEASLTSDSRPLAERAEEFGRHLERALAAGARAVAIDFVLPEAWSHSPAFSGLLVRNPDRVTLAALSAPSGDTVGVESTRGLTAVALGPARTLELFGFVNLDDDPDGIVRRARLSFPDRAGGHRDSWAWHATRRLLGPRASHEGTGSGTFLIDHTQDWSRLPRLSWKDVPRMLDSDPSAFRDRLLLVGGELLGSGDDYHRLPARPGREAAVSGVVLQALIVGTILDGRPIREVPEAVVLGLVGICSAAIAAVVLYRSRGRWGLVAVASVLACPFLGGVLLFQGWQLVLPVAAWLLALLVVLGLAMALRVQLPALPDP